MQPISFKARLISQPQIIRLDNPSNKKIKTSFIEMSPENPHDLEALNKSSIKPIIKYELSDWQMLSNSKKHIYALTTQTDKFEKPVPEKILGTISMVEEFNTNTNEIYSIKIRKDAKTPSAPSNIEKFVNTLLNIKEEKRKFAKVGSAMIESLQGIYENLTVQCNNHNYGFFFNKGFRALFSNDKNFLAWFK